jgi:hypothetical protein
MPRLNCTNCVDCGADITHRGNNTKRCEQCSSKRFALINREWRLANKSRVQENRRKYGQTEKFKESNRKKAAQRRRTKEGQEYIRKYRQSQAYKDSNLRTKRRCRHGKRFALEALLFKIYLDNLPQSDVEQVGKVGGELGDERGGEKQSGGEWSGDE